MLTCSPQTASLIVIPSLSPVTSSVVDISDALPWSLPKWPDGTQWSLPLSFPFERLLSTLWGGQCQTCQLFCIWRDSPATDVSALLSRSGNSSAASWHENNERSSGKSWKTTACQIMQSHCCVSIYNATLVGGAYAQAEVTKSGRATAAKISMLKIDVRQKRVFASTWLGSPVAEML